LALVLLAGGCITGAPTLGGTPCNQDTDCGAGLYCDKSAGTGVCRAKVETDTTTQGDVNEPPPAKCTVTADCAPYEDADRCNGTLACTEGDCVVAPETIPAAPPGLAIGTCEGLSCDPATGTFSVVPANVGAACDQDADVCTFDVCDQQGQCQFAYDVVGEGCQTTACTVWQQCDDGNPCTGDGCANGSCLHMPAVDGTSCAAFWDGDTDAPNQCSTSACHSGACLAATLSCDDGDACTADECLPGSGCLHKPIPDAPGCTTTGCTTSKDCDDKSACTTESCEAGTCKYKAAICDDGIACTVDSCHAVWGCTHEAKLGGVEICDNQLDDDCDGLLDCGDAECKTSKACAQTCGATATKVECGLSAVGKAGNNALTSYGCATGTFNGNEHVYVFTAQSSGTAYIYAYADDWETARLLVLKGTCASGSCIQASWLWDEEIALAVEAGNTYYLVVDAESPSFTYSELSLSCSTPEVCKGGQDEDWDGYIDCQDSDCQKLAPCESVEKSCGDGLDNDGDSKVDCADPDCAAAGPPCEAKTETKCTDKVDNDGDGWADCADQDCSGVGSCETPETSCKDGFDNDGDGKSDCDDADCAANAGCTKSCGPSKQVKCGDSWSTWGAEGKMAPPEPGGGLNYMSGYNCANLVLPGPEQVFAFTPESDGTINFYSYAEPWNGTGIMLLEGSCNSASCVAATLPSVNGNSGSLTAKVKGGTPYYLVVDSTQADYLYVYDGNLQCSKPEACDDGQDNDWDGKVDCADVDCLLAGAPCEASEKTCNDGKDNDGDGFADCYDANCIIQGAPCQVDETLCDDQIDNDGDYKTDCAEVSCQGKGLCEKTEITCDDGFDNDGDAYADCGDFDCAMSGLCVSECGLPTMEVGCNFSSNQVMTGSDLSKMDSYSCTNGYFPGGELVYTFTSEIDQQVEFSFQTQTGWGASLFLLAASCDSGSCVASSDGGVVPMAVDGGMVAPVGNGYLWTEVKAGQTYYLVVDSTQGGAVAISYASVYCYGKW
jgi:hypothetical protein